MMQNLLTKIFNVLYQTNLPLPYIYPTPEGGLSLEWDLAGNDITLEISFQEKIGQWHSLNLNTGEDVEMTFDFNDQQAWQMLVEQIKTFIK